jgi:transcriptional regulator with XRE-family HTH domain
MNDLGATLRTIRKTVGLTLDAAAGQADVTKGYLSKVERGTASPSIAVVSRLADVYGVRLADVFIPDGERGPIAVTRVTERTQINRNGIELGYVYEVGSPRKTNPRADIFFLTLPCLSEDTERPEFSHSGEEVLLVIEGQMQFTFAGTKILLGPGDCMQFDSSVHHHGVAIGGKDAKAFVVIIPDKREG